MVIDNHAAYERGRAHVRRTSPLVTAAELRCARHYANVTHGAIRAYWLGVLRQARAPWLGPDN